MARIRTIKPDFWEDEKIGLLSHGARLLFLGCLNLSDDEGLLRWNEMYLGSSIFTYDDIKSETIQKWMSEIVSQDLVFSYKGGQTKQSLGWIVNFHKHQRVDKPQPSKFPPPSLQNRDVQLVYFRIAGGMCCLCGTEISLYGENNTKNSTMLSMDHIKHKVAGGGDHPSNIRAVHIGCNKSRGKKSDNEYDSGSYINSWNDSKNNSAPEWNGNRREGNGTDGEGETKKIEIDFEKMCLEESSQWQESLMRKYKIKSIDEVKEWIKEFFLTLRAADQTKTDLPDAKSHCSRWINIQLEKINIKGPGPAKQGKAEAVYNAQSQLADYWASQAENE